MENLPEHIINKINEYIPHDKNMKSPVNPHIIKLIKFYNGKVIFRGNVHDLYLVKKMRQSPRAGIALRLTK